MSYDLTSTIRVFERQDWDARDSHPMSSQGDPTEAFVHHGAEAGAERIDVFTEQCAAMREIQRFHMDERGWSDIAYHYVIFQDYHKGVHARIFEGRPVHRVPASQFNHNTGTFAVCIYGNFQHDDQFHRNTRYALECLLTRKRHLTGAGKVKTIGGHRDVVDTTCPGDTIYAALPTIARATGLRLYHH